MLSVRYFVLLCMVLPSLVQIFSHDTGYLVLAEDDIDDTDADIQVDGDEGVLMTDEAAGYQDGQEQEDEEEEDGVMRPSPHADTTVLFVHPQMSTDASKIEIPCGELIELLIGFTNKGQQEFLLQSSETTIRYPQDTSYVIQNFSAVSYNKLIAGSQQASVYYSFKVSDTLASRPFHLEVDVKYSSANGRQYTSAVFNRTVEMIELNDSFNGETLFLYVLLAALAVLLLLAGQHALLTGFGRRRRGRRHAAPSSGGAASMSTAGGSSMSTGGGGGGTAVERGTAGDGALAGVDYDWLPENMLKGVNTPKNSPKQSPRSRKTHA